MVKAPDHPLAPPSGLVSKARVVLYDKIGPGPHTCHWCHRDIAWVIGQRGQRLDAIAADHVDSDPLNDSPDNLVPACGTCNANRARQVSDAEVYLTRKNGTRLRGEQRACEYCDAPFVTNETDPRKGRFCSRSCARRADARRRSTAARSG